MMLDACAPNASTTQVERAVSERQFEAMLACGENLSILRNPMGNLALVMLTGYKKWQSR